MEDILAGLRINRDHFRFLLGLQRHHSKIQVSLTEQTENQTLQPWPPLIHLDPVSEQWAWVSLHSFWFPSLGLLFPFVATNAQRCTWSLTIDKRRQHCDLFCLPLSVPADSSTSWIPWLSHRATAEWTAHGTTLAYCLFVSDPWCLPCAYKQTKLNPSACFYWVDLLVSDGSF